MGASAEMSVGARFLAEQPQTLIPNVTFTSPAPALSQVICQQYYINANYTTPASNQPAANNNMVFVFEGGPPLPSQNPAYGSGVCTGNQTQGNATAQPASKPFYSEDYVLAYSVGPSVTPKGGSATYPNVAATAYIPGGVGSGLPMQFFGSSLGFVANGVSPTAIQWAYQFVPGTNPVANGAFIGLWPSILSNPYGTAPVSVAQIFNAGQSSGSAIMGGLNLAIGSQYTAALFASGFPLTAGAAAPTAIVAWIQFTLLAP
jgi:hypothetical protein